MKEHIETLEALYDEARNNLNELESCVDSAQQEASNAENAACEAVNLCQQADNYRSELSANLDSMLETLEELKQSTDIEVSVLEADVREWSKKVLHRHHEHITDSIESLAEHFSVSETLVRHIISQNEAQAA